MSSSPPPPSPSNTNWTLLASGWTAKIYRDPATQLAIKVFPLENTPHFLVEKRAYERFSANSPPPSILRYHGTSRSVPTCIILDLAPLGDIYGHRDGIIFRMPLPQRLDLYYKWARQAAEAFAFTHSVGVFNSDIYTSNFVLDEQCDLKVCDWAGASMQGELSLSSYRRTHQLWEDGQRTVTSVRTEVFALGCALYHMVVGHDLWPELDHGEDKEEIERRLRAREMPDLEELDCLKEVVRKCWDLEYVSMNEIAEGIEIERLREGVLVRI